MTRLLQQPETITNPNEVTFESDNMGGGIYDGGLDTTIEGTVGGALIIVGGVALIAMFFVCMYRRFKRIRRRFDHDDDIEKGANKRNSHKRGNDHSDRRRKHEEKKRKTEKTRKSKNEGRSEKDKNKHKKRVEETDSSDDSDGKKKARREKEKMIEKKIEKKLKEKMEKKMDRKIDEIIDKRNKREKKRNGNGGLDHERSRSRRHSHHHHHHHHKSSRSRRRHHDENYYDPGGYYNQHSWNYRYYGPYSNNDSLWHNSTYPKSVVTKTTAPDSIGSSWRSDHPQDSSIFLGSPIKPLRTSGMILPTTDVIDQISWSSLEEESSDPTFPDEETEETPSSLESFSKFLIQQLSIYRSTTR